MGFDPQKNGWSTITQMTNTVTLPEELTAKWWDKKKQVVAKMTKSTGMGDALKELDAVFKKVVWEEFNPHPLAVQERVDQMKKWITSTQVKALHDELKTVRDLAKEQAKSLKKNPLTKKTADVLEEIADVADKAMVCINPGSLTSCLKEAIIYWQKDQNSKAVANAGTTVNNALAVHKTLAQKIKNLRDLNDKFDVEEDRQTLFGNMYTLGRNMTQPLGNLIKAHKAGVALQNYDEKAIDKLFEQLKPIGGAQTHTAFTSGLDQAKSSKLIDKFETWGNEFVRITKDIKLPAPVKV